MASEIPKVPVAASGALSVSDLTRAIRHLLETRVGRVEVEGEISNWTQAASGHAYFALKDEGAVLSCVLFRSGRSRLAFTPADGVKAVACGRISVYEQRGQYQMVVESMRESGVGDLYRRFLELKEKLEKEGLFDEARKRPIPPLPGRIGVVTSPTGAVLRDIIHVVRRRFAGVELVLSPTPVQGAEAPGRIVRAIERLNALSAAAQPDRRIEALIVARGGGSIEDLWAFNDERVARAIAASAIPVISAVGHETDFTIADFAADVRAPTPSAAAEIVVREVASLIEAVGALRRRMRTALEQQVRTRSLELRRLSGSWGMRQPLEIVRQAIQRVDELYGRAQASLRRLPREARRDLEALAGRLEALSPEAVLARGYSVVSRARDSRIITGERQVRLGDHVRIRLSKGELRASVIPRGDDIFDGIEVDPQPSPNRQR